MTEKLPIRYFDTFKELKSPLVGVWHARGNQGAVVATEILAKLVMRAKGYATSFPVFGAAKEGEPIKGHNRIGAKPIEAFYTPNKFDYVVIMDPSIDNAPGQITGTFLAGTNNETIFIVNTTKEPEEIARELELGPVRVITVDATGIVLRLIPKTKYLNTAMLGALIHIFPNISLKMLKEEIAETENLVEKGEMAVAQNIAAAEESWKSISEFDGRGTNIPRAALSPQKLPNWNEIEPAAAIPTTANACAKKTGKWRTERPVRAPKKCTNCMLCYQFCPDFAIKVNADETEIVEIDYDHCKGCGICKKVCPFHAIGFIPEAKAQKKEREKK